MQLCIWLFGWLFVWMIGWLVGWLVGQLCGWLIGWFVGCMVGLLICYLFMYLVRQFSQLVTYLVTQLVHQVGRKVDMQLCIWLSVWMICWLYGWLVDLLFIYVLSLVQLVSYLVSQTYRCSQTRQGPCCCRLNVLLHRAYKPALPQPVRISPHFCSLNIHYSLHGILSCAPRLPFTLAQLPSL